MGCLCRSLTRNTVLYTALLRFACMYLQVDYWCKTLWRLTSIANEYMYIQSEWPDAVLMIAMISLNKTMVIGG